MLSRDKRLNLKTSFSFVIKGQKSENQILKIFFRQGEQEKPLVGIALKKEFFKLAVDRNRARRLTSWAVEQLYSKLVPRLNLVLMPKTEILKLSSREALEILKKELNRLKLLI
jgi:ribonuclease P protein component